MFLNKFQHENQRSGCAKYIHTSCANSIRAKRHGSNSKNSKIIENFIWNKLWSSYRHYKATRDIHFQKNFQLSAVRCCGNRAFSRKSGRKTHLFRYWRRWRKLCSGEKRRDYIWKVLGFAKNMAAEEHTHKARPLPVTSRTRMAQEILRMPSKLRQHDTCLDRQ